MICPDCKREHLHDPGEYLVVESFEQKGGGHAAQVIDPETRVVRKILFSRSPDHADLEQKVHNAFPRQSLHWHYMDNWANLRPIPEALEAAK